MGVHYEGSEKDSLMVIIMANFPVNFISYCYTLFFANKVFTLMIKYLSVTESFYSALCTQEVFICTFTVHFSVILQNTNLYGYT